MQNIHHPNHKSKKSNNGQSTDSPITNSKAKKQKTRAAGRRQFFKKLGSGLVVAFVFSDLKAVENWGKGTPENPEQFFAPDEIGAWLHIGQDNIITVFTGKVEVGQNIRTSLTQTVAEELMVPVENIKMIMGDTDLVPYDRGTFGSRTTPFMGPQLKKAAATAREMMLEKAAGHFGTNKNELKIEEGVVHEATGKSISYGELTKGEKLLKTINDDIAFTPAENWKVSGKSIPKVNGKSFINGKHQYVTDLTMPEMLHGKILRPEAYGAKISSIDLSKAEAMEGVTVVRDGDFVGVTAPSTRLANKALAAIEVNWQLESQPSQGEIFEYLKKNSSDGRETDSKGDVQKGFDTADHSIQQTFNIEYIAHAPLEPRAGVAKWEDGKLTAWTGTQRPFGVKDELAKIFDLPDEKVRVIMPDTGSGYGGKHTGEAAIEAARLAKAVGKPVKVVWTREEEFTWAYFRPAGVIDANAVVKNDGTITAWEFHNYNSGGSGIDNPYKVANQKIAFHPSESPLRQGSYRGLASTANIFAREAMISDLARLIGMDTLEFRVKNLEDQRIIDVLKAAAEDFAWEAKPSNGNGFGIACGAVKGGYVAACAEVSVDQGNGDFKIHRIVQAFECGAIVNPKHLENQILGSVVQGLGGALFEVVNFENGKILNPKFSSYRVPRFKDMPEIKIVMVDRKDLPSVGGGETPIVGVAPAIRNAIADATGLKLNALPFAPNGLGNYFE